MNHLVSNITNQYNVGCMILFQRTHTVLVPYSNASNTTIKFIELIYNKILYLCMYSQIFECYNLELMFVLKNCHIMTLLFSQLTNQCQSYQNQFHPYSRKSFGISLTRDRQEKGSESVRALIGPEALESEALIGFQFL